MINPATSSGIPAHIGLILDGNRRWAREHNLPTLEGHRKGYDNLKTITRQAFKKGVKYVSAYIFSTENWNRTKEEVDYLMKLAMRIATKDAKELIKENIKIVILGVEDRLDPTLVRMWRQTEEDSKDNTGGTLALCFNYGGLQEVSDAVKGVIQSGIEAAKVTEQVIASHLYHPEVPPIDLVIRSSGEHRISNFMLWRVAYAELYFSTKYWPAFNEDDLDAALADFAARTRRFGG